MVRLPCPGVDDRAKWIRYKMSKSLSSSIQKHYGFLKREREVWQVFRKPLYHIHNLLEIQSHREDPQEPLRVAILQTLNEWCPLELCSVQPARTDTVAVSKAPLGRG